MTLISKMQVQKENRLRFTGLRIYCADRKKVINENGTEK